MTKIEKEITMKALNFYGEAEKKLSEQYSVEI